MARFRYNAIDSSGRPQSGEIEAASADQAYLTLSSRRLRPVIVEPALDASSAPGPCGAADAPHEVDSPSAAEPIVLELVEDAAPTPSTHRPSTRAPVLRGVEPPRLAGDDAQQLAAQLAILARAGLPLGLGLRAAAQEAPSRRLQQALFWLADQLDAGRPLDELLGERPYLVPEHVRRLISVGVRSGRLPEALDELVEIDRSSRDLARNLRLALAYPLLLVTLFAVLFVAIEVMVVPGMLDVYEEFDLPLPWRVKALFWLSGERMLVAVGIVITAIPMLMLVARAARPPSIRRGAVTWIPLYGPAVFWRAVASWSRLLALLLDYGVPAPDALRMASDGSYNATVRAAGRHAAQVVSAGHTMADAVWAARRLPGSLAPLLGWGEKVGSLPDALRSGAEMFEDRVRLRAALLRSALPPIVFVFVAVGGLFLLATLLLPLFSLIESLT